MREYSTPVAVDVPASARLTDIVFERAEQDPGLVVMRRKASLAPPGHAGRREAAWLDITARQFRDEVAALAKGLIAAGIGAGDRVALLSRTRYEWTVVDYALWAAGAVTVPVYETSSAEQVEWILTDSGARRSWSRPRRTWRRSARCCGGCRASADVADRGRCGRAVARRAGGRGRRGRRGRPGPAPDVGRAPATSPRSSTPRAPPAARRDARSPTATCWPTCATRSACRCRRSSTLPGASTLLFLPLAHSFARIIQVGCLEAGAVLGHIPDAANAAAGPGHVPAHVHPGRAPGLREGLQRRGAAGVGERGQGRDLPRGGPDRDRLEPRARHRRQALARRGQRAGPRAAAPARTLRPAGLPQAARRGRRPGAVRGVRRRRPRANGSATSSAARGSPSSRATG